MSELTKENLEEYARDGRNAGDCEVEQMARELLALRSRDAGDEEVLHQRAVVCNGIWSKDKRDNEEADKAIDSIVSTVVSLRQQLRDAREEIERLKGCLKKSNDGFEEHERLWYLEQNKTETLTAERDEARKEVESERIYSLSMKSLADECSRNQQRQIDTLISELAALKSCPTMAEVDDILTPWVGQPFKSIIDNFEEMRDLARRSITSREEVVGLLKWLDEIWDFKEVKKCLCEYASDKVYGNDQQKARRILEIVEGK